MILELKGIYKEYQQGKMKVPVLKDEFLHGRRRIRGNYGTIRFGKNYSDEHYRMSGQADRGDFFWMEWILRRVRRMKCQISG